MKIGAEVTRIPASEEEISVSPAASSRNGPAIWESPMQHDAAGHARRSRRAPRGGQAKASRTGGAERHAAEGDHPGERSRTPILISM